MTCVVLLGGLVWGFYRFKAERSAEVADKAIAQASLEAQRLQVETGRLQYEQQKAAHDVKLLDQYSMNVDVRAWSARSTSTSNAWTVGVEVALKNTGKADFQVELAKGQFYLARFEGSSADGSPVYGARRALKLAFPDNVYPTVAAPPDGQPRLLHAITEVYVPGHYVVRFRVPNPGSPATTILAGETFVAVGVGAESITPK